MYISQKKEFYLVDLDTQQRAIAEVILAVLRSDYVCSSSMQVNQKRDEPDNVIRPGVSHLDKMLFRSCSRDRQVYEFMDSNALSLTMEESW